MAEPDTDDHTDGEDETDRPLPTYYRRMKGGSASAALGAAMVAVGEIFEPEKTTVAIEQVDEDGDDPDRLDLDFGELPDLG